MSCILTGGHSINNCPTGTGGTKVLGIGAHDKDKNYAAELDGTLGNKIIGHDDTALALYKFEQELETAVVTENFVGDRNTNTGFWEVSIALTLHYTADETINDGIIESITELVTKGNMLVTATDNNGISKVYGVENGLRVTSGEGGNGTAFGDLNGISLTLTGREPRQAYLVEFLASTTETAYEYA